MNIPPIKNALENIITACQKKLSYLYPTGVPEPIQIRYEQELSFFKHSKYIDDFEIFRLLSEEANKSSYIISARGTIMGSFLYYLLGTNCYNPLPVYYYCPKCGYYEAVQTHLFGIDLPEKTCPNCDNTIYADGFNLSTESVWGLDGKKIISFDYNVCSEFLPFAKRILTKIYPNNIISSWGMFQIDPVTQMPHPDQRVIGVGLAGYAILPTGNIIDDYSELISYLEDGEPCLTGGGWELEQNQIKAVRLFSFEYIDKLMSLQRATGLYVNELSISSLRDITWSNIFNTTTLCQQTSMLFHELKPKTFRDMIALEASAHNTTIWQKQGEMYIDFYDFTKMTSTEAFKKYPCFTREDFFDYLIESEVDRETAFLASEMIRKGQASEKTCTSHWHEKFHSLQIPEEIKEVAKNYLYLFPRAHCIEYVLIFARLAYYAKTDSRAFSKIIFKKKSQFTNGLYHI